MGKRRDEGAGSTHTRPRDRPQPRPHHRRAHSPILVSRAHLETRLRQRRHKPPRPDPRLAPRSCFVVKPLNGLQVRAILDHDEELEALLSRVAASRRLVIDVDPAEKTRRDGQALVAVTIALTANLRAAPGKGSRSCSRSTPTASTAMPPPPTSASPTRSAPKTPSQTRVTRVMAAPGGLLKCQVRVGIRVGAVSETAPTGPVRGFFRPRPWPVRASSVVRSAPVRGQFAARSVACAAPGTRCPRTHR